MTPQQLEIATAFGHIRFLPGAWDKRFAFKMHAWAQSTPDKPLSEKQDEWLYRILYKYRKQLPVTYNRFKNNPLCSKKQRP